mgnify:CR=1 FL=1
MITEYYVEGIDLTSESTVVRSISRKYNISSRHKLLSQESELMKEAKRVRALSGMRVATSLAYI